ncbi:MAG: glucose/galactose MFS transporter [Rikenellaceae bacterium]
MQKSTIAVALSFIGLMFFSVGFAMGINSFLIPTLQSSLSLSASSSYMLIAATFTPFLLWGIPASMLISAVGYKRSMAIAFAIFACAFLLFVASAKSNSFILFITASFISGSANAILQTAINPYITILGPIESAARRMSIMGICNKLAWPVAPLLFALLVRDSTNVTTADLYTPFYVIVAIFALLGVVSLIIDLPEITVQGETQSDSDVTEECSYAANKTSIWQFPHLILGAVTLFIYVGVETLSLSTAVDYATSLGLANPDTYAWIPSIGMVVGYICGILFIPRYLSQQLAMRLCATMGIVGSLAMVLIPAELSIWMIFLMSLGCSLMWPALWPLAIADLGKFTKRGSGLLTMAIAGGAVVPLIFGFLKDILTMQQAYWLAVPCFVFIFFYGFVGYKIRS